MNAYLARLQNLAGEKPLLLAEVGVDSRSEGTTEQARQLASQLEVAAEAGAAGAFVFAWTDEWHRGGDQVLDWDFGLTTAPAARSRRCARQARRSSTLVSASRAAASSCR